MGQPWEAGFGRLEVGREPSDQSQRESSVCIRILSLSGSGTLTAQAGGLYPAQRSKQPYSVSAGQSGKMQGSIVEEEELELAPASFPFP
jgi:hypothetical protein